MDTVIAPTLTCKRCGTEKPITAFRKHTNTKCGRIKTCYVCHNQSNRERDSNLTLDERRTEYLRWDKSRRNGQYKRYFGITLDEYNALVAKQNGVCAICKSNRTSRRLAVDHCHTTGKIRGLLCGKCNSGIGYFDDNPTILSDAIKYLAEKK